MGTHQREDHQAGGRHLTVIVYDWSTGGGTGWGTYGAALARYGPDCGVDVLATHPPEEPGAVRTVSPDRIPKGAIVLTGMGDNGGTIRQGYPVPAPHPARQVGVIFSEQTNWDAVGRARLDQYDQIVAGSTWNGAVIAPLTHRPVSVVFQGVDPALFHGRPAHDHMAMRDRLGLTGKVVVFSGGKLEYRKGQDLVIAAFSLFRAVVPNAVLVTAWHNRWPQTMRTLQHGGYVHSLPLASSGPQLTAWLGLHGIPSDAHRDLGPCSHAGAAEALAASDLAVFPNRAEGGTNLVAMEAIASGVPTVITHGHGHADLVPMVHGRTVTGASVAVPFLPADATEGWVEASPESLVHAMLETMTMAPTENSRMWSWDQQIRTLIDTVTA